MSRLEFEHPTFCLWGEYYNRLRHCRGRDNDRQLKYICGQLRKEKDRHLDKLLGTEEWNDVSLILVFRIKIEYNILWLFHFISVKKKSFDMYINSNPKYFQVIEISTFLILVWFRD